MKHLRAFVAAGKVVDEEVRAIGPRKCSATPPVSDESALTEAERSNLRSKEAFEDRIVVAGLGDHSVRDLALFFGVKRSKLYERMTRRRTDLAPLPEWFQKLDDYIEFNRLYALFVRSA